MAITEDFDLYFTDFGADATLGGQPVRGFFAAPGVVSQVGVHGMATTEPTFTLPTGALVAVQADPVGLPLVVGGVPYTVAEHQPDGTGISTLVLQLPRGLA